MSVVVDSGKQDLLHDIIRRQEALEENVTDSIVALFTPTCT